MISSVEPGITGTRYGPDGKHDEEDGSQEEMIVPTLEALMKSHFLLQLINLSPSTSFGKIDSSLLSSFVVFLIF